MELPQFDMTDVPTLGTENLANYEWREGGYGLIGTGPGPRHAHVAVMTELGNREAVFKGGVKGKYSALTGIINADGVLGIRGGHAIPIFPNGDVLMLGVNRPGFVGTRRSEELMFANGTTVTLHPAQSVEFSGGTKEKGDKNMRATAVREMLEEHGLQFDEKTLFWVVEHMDPIHLAIAEMILAINCMIVYIPEMDFPSYVENDGGIRAFRLSMDDIRLNRRRGLFTAASTIACLSFLERMADSTERRLMAEHQEIVRRRMALTK